METTRRLSLTLLLVAPLISAQDPSVDLSLSSVTGEHLPLGRPRRPRPEVDDQEETTTTGDLTSTQTSTTDQDNLPTTEITTMGDLSGLQESGSGKTKGRNGGESPVTEEELSLGRPHKDDQVNTSSTRSKERPTRTQIADDKSRGLRRRSVGAVEDMETAEQVVFRPYFRNRQSQADRKTSEDAAVRKQELEALDQKYPYLYQYYPLKAVRSRRSLQPLQPCC